MKYTHNKVLGMLWGLHAGDSLGAPLEFLPPSPVWHFHTEITGGGLFRWKAGEATDDTDLMLCVLRAIENSHHISFDFLKKEMLAWFESRPPDIGTTTVRGLRNLKAGLPLKLCGYVNDKFQGNGSLMRVAPLSLLVDHAVGAYQGASVYSLSEIIETQTKMTHGHRKCVEADRVLIQALKKALDGASKQQIYFAAIQEAQQISKELGEKVKALSEISWVNLSTSGDCVETLCAGLWAFLKFNTFEDSVIAVVNRGDDSDSCGAVAGSLCGAYYGAAAIPQRWLDVLEYREEISSLLKQKNLTKE